MMLRTPTTKFIDLAAGALRDSLDDRSYGSAHDGLYWVDANYVTRPPHSRWRVAEMLGRGL